MTKRITYKIIAALLCIGLMATMGACASKRNASGFKCPPSGQ